MEGNYVNFIFLSCAYIFCCCHSNITHSTVIRTRLYISIKMTHNYTKIEDTKENSEATNRRIHAMEMGDGSESSEDIRFFYRQPVQFTIVGIVVLTVLYFFNSYFGQYAHRPPSFCPPCSFAQCESASCDQATSPMVCLSGATVGGCAALESNWKDNDGCDSCCDSSRCSEATPTGTDDSIELCPECPIHQCDTVAAACGLNSFMCLEGEAAGGCTTDKYHWPTAGESVCKKCCDGVNC